MRFSYLLAALLAFSLVTACNPKAVDPDAEFTIEGSAVDADGNPAANTRIHIYKVDSVFSRDNNFLQYTVMDDGIDPNDTHYATTDASGNFSLTLRGSEVNTEGGGGAAYLVVVYFDQGIEDYLATASDWHYFTDADPIWEVGELELWNGGTATQVADTITFSWNSPPAPADNSRATEMPSFYFVWEYESDFALPTWANHLFGTSAEVPRAAFNSSASGLEWFVTSFSKDGSRYFQHRSSLHTFAEGQGFETSYIMDELTNPSTLLYEGHPSTGPAFSNGQATDGDMDSFYDFQGTSVVDIYIDLGSLQIFDSILLHDLIVRNFGNATISAHACFEDPSSNLDCSTQVGTEYQGDWEFVGQDAFVYLDATATTSVRWLRISVRPKGGTGVTPYFDAVADIRVVSYY